jgi:predicted LPLAT superfamily acyltransferase
MSGAPAHWASRPERGSGLLMRLTARAARLLGRRALSPLVLLIVLYFYATSRRARQAIAQYQRRLAAHSRRADLFPARLAVYRQYLTFAETLLDKLDAWQGGITLADLDIDDPDGLHAQMTGQRPGQILVCSHIGNLEACRALAGRDQGVRLTVLVHSHNAVRFNRVLAEAGADNLNLVQVSELDAGAMLELSRRVERGEWLAIAGDRVPLTGNRTVEVDFLGAPAPLPQGPWLLAGLLRCPVNVLFCTRDDKRYRLTLRRLSARLSWTRATRDGEIRRHAQRYADALAEACRQAPLQWFNFYPFWSDHA